LGKIKEVLIRVARRSNNSKIHIKTTRPETAPNIMPGNVLLRISYRKLHNEEMISRTSMTPQVRRKTPALAIISKTASGNMASCSLRVSPIKQTALDSRMTLIIAARQMPAAINSFACDANPLRDATNKTAVIAAKLVAMKAAFAQLSSELPAEIAIPQRSSSHPRRAHWLRAQIASLQLGQPNAVCKSDCCDSPESRAVARRTCRKSGCALPRPSSPHHRQLPKSHRKHQYSRCPVLISAQGERCAIAQNGLSPRPTRNRLRRSQRGSVASRLGTAPSNRGAVASLQTAMLIT
jgi:hypothetical protein